MKPDYQPSCSEPDCGDIAPLIASVALGGQLEPEEQSRLVNRLLQCSQCIQRLHDYHTVTELVCLGLPQTAPSPVLRERILATARLKPSPAKRRRMPRQLWRPALQIAPIILAIVMLFWNINLQAQVRSNQGISTPNSVFYLDLYGDKTVTRHALQATKLATDAEGVVWLSSNATALCLYADHLPELPADQVYQLWLSHNGEFVSAGTFSTDQKGRAWVIVQLSMPLDTLQATRITIEPRGGSAQPRGPALLTGHL